MELGEWMKLQDRSPKVKHIFECALEIIKKEGVGSLTMRKLSTIAGMSLSNLQYYFKNKDALLDMVTHDYVIECVDQLNTYQKVDGSLEQEVKSFIVFFLEHLSVKSDMCVVFRELWALSSRDKKIEDYLKSYYENLGERVGKLIQSFDTEEKNIQQALSVLIPFFEGYSLTHNALPLDKKGMANLMTELTLKALGK